MPKITKHGGPSFAIDEELPPGFQLGLFELGVEGQEEPAPEDSEEGEQPSLGNSSSQSELKQPKNEDSDESLRLLLAPTTENP